MVHPWSLLAATQSSVSPAGAGRGDDLPGDLTALSLAQLMNVPVRAPDPEDEAEDEVAEEDSEDGETIPGVAPDRDGRAAGDDGAPAPQASHNGADFGTPDLGEAGAELPEELAFTLALEGDDPLGDGDPSVADGGFEPLQFLIANDPGGNDSAQAFDLAGSSDQSDPGQGGSQPSGLTLTGSSANDTLTGGSGDDTLTGLNGDDTLTGLAGADTLIGGNGTDILDGGAGADTLLGGNGNDTLTWDALDITIDGGNGQDTLLAAGADIDLTAFGGTLASIESIDLSGDGANSVALGVQDILDMSSSGTVTIEGDLGDSVDAGTGWTDAGIAGGFHVYTQGLATIKLDVDLTANLDIVS